MRPRLIAVDDGLGELLVIGALFLASMRPRLIAVDDLVFGPTRSVDWGPLQ